MLVLDIHVKISTFLRTMCKSIWPETQSRHWPQLGIQKYFVACVGHVPCVEPDTYCVGPTPSVGPDTLCEGPTPHTLRDTTPCAKNFTQPCKATLKMY